MATGVLSGCRGATKRPQISAPGYIGEQWVREGALRSVLDRSGGEGTCPCACVEGSYPGRGRCIICGITMRAEYPGSRSTQRAATVARGLSHHSASACV